jgi:hypothetical protein
MRRFVSLLSAAALVVALAGVATAAPSDPFKGAWASIDTDGSNQTLTFGGNGSTRRVTLFDDGASVCDGMVPATGRGTGTVDGSSLSVTYLLSCHPGGSFTTPEVTYTHDAGSNTLTDSFGVTWSRP